MSTTPFPLSVTGVKKTHGTKAVKWLRDRSLLAWYDAKGKELRAWEFTKYGPEWTYKALHRALEETR